MLDNFYKLTLIFFTVFVYKTTGSTLQEIQDKFVSHLFVYEATNFNETPVILERIGREYDGGYVVPSIACSNADVCLGYGIGDDPSFEIMFSDKFQKLSFGFDGGAENPSQTHPLFTFIPECIGTDSFLYSNQRSSEKVDSFDAQVEKLGLIDKKIFLKMDIEGAEIEVLPSILEKSHQITGMAIEFHNLWNLNIVIKTIEIIEIIEKNFILMHVHNNNGIKASNSSGFFSKYAKGEFSPVIELTYLNKNLVSSFEKSKNQKFPKEMDMKNISHVDDMFFELLDLGDE